MPVFTSYATGTPCWVDVTSPELDQRGRIVCAGRSDRRAHTTMP